MMTFTLTGFSQEAGFRLFAFEGISAERAKTAYVVKVNISLIGKYGIKVQELPLLCRKLLDKCEHDADTRTLIFTEAEMCTQRDERAAALSASIQKRKAFARPLNSVAGTAWRTSSPKL